ncbi:hypothetical protein ACFYO7_13230 [Nocardia salmonicida]
MQFRGALLAGADIGTACDLAITASLAVLRAVDPEQLRAIDTHVPTTP